MNGACTPRHLNAKKTCAYHAEYWKKEKTRLNNGADSAAQLVIELWGICTIATQFISNILHERTIALRTSQIPALRTSIGVLQVRTNDAHEHHLELVQNANTNAVITGLGLQVQILTSIKNLLQQEPLRDCPLADYSLPFMHGSLAENLSFVVRETEEDEVDRRGSRFLYCTHASLKTLQEESHAALHRLLLPRWAPRQQQTVHEHVEEKRTSLKTHEERRKNRYSSLQYKNKYDGKEDKGRVELMHDFTEIHVAAAADLAGVQAAGAEEFKHHDQRFLLRNG